MTEKLEENNNLTEPRDLPKNTDAERALLSAILINNRAYEKVSEFLFSEHFAEKANGKIYSACIRLIEKGHLADPITLKNFLEQDGELQEIGGEDYINSLIDASVSIINVEDYGKLIRDRAVRRELIDLGQNIANSAYKDDLETTAFDQIEQAEQKLFELATIGQLESGFSSFSKALTDAVINAEYAYKSDSNISGLSTGFTDLDKMIGGLHQSDLMILAGRPGMGKTNVALNLAFNAANEVLNGRNPKDLEGPVAFFSLEMSSDQLAARILSSQAEVSAHKMRTGNINEEEFERLTEFAKALDTVPLYIDDTPGISVPAIRTRARRLARNHGDKLSLIVIDYLQLLSAPGGQRVENRVQELSQMTRGLKILAKELNVPVLALSQLSRQVEQREDKKPQLSDLRESGSIEQDADIVMFVYREFYYHQMKEPDPNTDKYQTWAETAQRIKNKADILIEKQRHGPTGKVGLFYHPEFFKLTDYYDSGNDKF